MGRFFIGNGEKWNVDLNGLKKNSPPAPLQKRDKASPPAPLQKEGTEKLKPTIKLKVDDGEIAVLPFIICLF